MADAVPENGAKVKQHPPFGSQHAAAVLVNLLEFEAADFRRLVQQTGQEALGSIG